MKALFLALAIAASPAWAGKCTKNDAWTGVDKAAHGSGGAVIGGAVTLLTGSPEKATLTVIAVAALKEAADRRSSRHTCSLQDFAVTVAGGVAGAYGTSWLVGPNYIGFTKRF